MLIKCSASSTFKMGIFKFVSIISILLLSKLTHILDYVYTSILILSALVTELLCRAKRFSYELITALSILLILYTNPKLQGGDLFKVISTIVTLLTNKRLMIAKPQRDILILRPTVGLFRML